MIQDSQAQEHGHWGARLRALRQSLSTGGGRAESLAYLFEALLEAGVPALILLVALFYSPELSDTRIGKLAAVHLMGGLLAGLWLMRAAVQGRLRLEGAVFWRPFLVYLGVSLAALALAHNRAQGAEVLLTQVWLFLLCMLALHHFRDPAAISGVLWTAVLTGLVVASLGVLQYNGIHLIPLPKAYGDLPISTLGNPNFVAHYLEIIIPLTLALLAVRRRWWEQALLGLTLVLTVAHLVVSGSRAGWLALAAALAFWFWSRLSAPARRLRQVLLGAVVAALLSAPLGLVLDSIYLEEGKSLSTSLSQIAQSTWDRALSGFDPQNFSVAQRLIIWKDTLDLIRDHPLLGVGVGNWKIFYPLYARTVRVDPAFSAEVQPTHTHNDFLEICAETGMPGLALWLWIILAALRLAWQAFAHARDPALDLLLLALTTGMLAMLGSALINFPLMAPVPSFFLWSWLGLLHQVAYQKEVPTLRGLSTRRRWHLSAGLRALGWGLAALAVTSFAVFNGFRLLSDFHYRQGVEYRREKKNAQAVHELEAAVWYNPFDYKYLHTLGNAYLDNGMVDEALRTWLATLRYHPYHMNTHNNLGTAYARAGDMQRAFTHFRIALSINPEYPEARNNLGTVYSRMGLLEEAAQEYRKALEIRPDYATAQKNLDALLRYRQGR